MIQSSNEDPVLNIGAVGLGWAFLGMMPSFMDHPLVNITAVADTRTEAREKFAADHGVKAYASMEELCKDPSIDAVYIATPHAYHAEQAIMAAQHGKHVMVEKPLALSIEDSQAVIAAVDRAGVKLMVGHTNSFDAPILKIREIVHSGELGKLRLVNTFNYTEYLYRPRRPEELDTNLGGGILFNQTPHQVDMVRFIGGGLVRSVRAATGVWDPDRPTEGAALAFLDFEDGAVGTVLYNGYAHFNADEFLGRAPNLANYGAARRRLQNVAQGDEEAAMKAAMGYGGPNQMSYGQSAGATEHERFGVLIASCDRGDVLPSATGVTIYGDDEIRSVPVPFGRGGSRRATVVDEFYDAITLDKPVIHDARWGLATLEVCLAILESSQTRKEVYLSHQVPTRDWD